MENFSDLEELYSHLEINKLFKNDEIILLFKQVRDSKLSKEGKTEFEISQLEMDVFSFDITDGNLISKHSFSDENGSFNYYPSIETFDEETYDYLIARLDFTSNPHLKATYSTILWNGKKHAKFAKTAVDAFDKLINIHKDDEKSKDNWFFLGKSLTNSFSIGSRVDYEIDRLKMEFIDFIKNFESYDFLLAVSLINWMWVNRKKFDNHDFFDIPDICWKLSSETLQFNHKLHIVDVGEKIEQKINTKKYDWPKKRALIFEKLMEENERDNKLAALGFCLEAINIYRSIKNEEKLISLEKKYKELNVKIEFNKISYSSEDINSLLDKIKAIAIDFVNERSSDEIIGDLMLDEGLIIPDYQHIVELTTKLNETFPLSALLPKTIMDNRGHPAQHFKKKNERKRHDIIFYYLLSIRMVQEPLIANILMESIIQNKISARIILKFFKDHTWIKNRWTLNEKTTENWLALIAPSIIHYFNELQNFGMNSNFILSIDSLAMKIEGIIRDLCILIDPDIITSKTDFKNGIIKQEKNINDLLHDKKLEGKISKNDLEYLKIILVEQSGYNLRNEIAHSFLPYQAYGMFRMNHLFISLLRLCKYEYDYKSIK